jgi:D-cysteine desulfhydrase
LTPRVHARWPELRFTLPWWPLGQGPTPVRRLAALPSGPECDVWIKDDGAYGSVYGGNKVRKLEWILPDAAARGCRTIVTVGALGTNHGLATARYAREHGMRCAIALVDQPVDDHVRRQLERLERSGARLYRTHGRYRTYAAAPFIFLRHLQLRPPRLPYFLAVGGSTPVGCVGFVEAALELAEQIDAGLLPEPSHVVVPLGSGGTAAGLAAGLRVAGLRTRVVGIVVNDKTPVDGAVVAGLASRTLHLLRQRGAALRDMEVPATALDAETAWLGAGYGHRTAESEAARAAAAVREGIELDPVYTAKTVAGLLALRERGRFGTGPVLFWQTHDTLAGGEPGD